MITTEKACAGFLHRTRRLCPPDRNWTCSRDTIGTSRQCALAARSSVRSSGPVYFGPVFKRRSGEEQLPKNENVVGVFHFSVSYPPARHTSHYHTPHSHSAAQQKTGKDKASLQQGSNKRTHLHHDQHVLSVSVQQEAPGWPAGE